jgi:geranylgeranyl reductase family protein
VQTQTDVVVVGAGPAGSFAALTAAKMGVEVIVCEEHKEVGSPCHCPGHISIKGLDKLGLRVPEKIIENRISGAVFYSPSGNEFRVKLSSPVTYVINRTGFDKHLAQLAERAGAKLLLGTRVNELLVDNDSVSGVSLKGRGHLSSKVVVDAEGCASTLLRQIGLQTFDRSLTVSAVNGELSHIDGLEDDTVEVYLGQKYASGLYAWIIPKRDGSAKIGLATKTGNPREHLKLFLDKHPTARKKAKFNDVKNLSYHLIPLGGPIRKTYHSGFIAVGDAASHVKPTTGGGVIMGLTCAKIAGETAYQAKEQSDFSENFLTRYQQRWQNAIAFDMAVMRKVRLMLNRLSDPQLDRIVSLCSKLRLDKALQGFKDLDFQGRSLLPILKSPRALIVAVYFFLASMM